MKYKYAGGRLSVAGLQIDKVVITALSKESFSFTSPSGEGTVVPDGERMYFRGECRFKRGGLWWVCGEADPERVEELPYTEE